MDWRQLISNKRFGMEEFHAARKDDRSEFQRDYDRLVFSAPFRRLQNKTQVFPLPGSVFVHNRLTHSLEVSCVGRSLSNIVARELLLKHPDLSDSHLSEIGAIVSAACLAHDLGNPPFGHSGEKAISTYFSQGKGKIFQEQLKDTPGAWDDLTHFEGNANAFRLLTHQFEGRRKGGFVMTYSTLASIVKYPYSSCLAGDKSKFGFFLSEEEDYKRIATELGIIRLGGELLHYVRHPLVFLVEAADDICYQLMDMEDAYKLRILTADEIKGLLLGFLDEKKVRRFDDVCSVVRDANEQIAYLRSSVIGLLIDECAEVFINNEKAILAGTFAGALINHISPRSRAAYVHCTEVSSAKIYRSSDVLDIELAGFQVINTLIDIMIEAVSSPGNAYSKLLMDRISDQYNIHAASLYEKIQAVLDYVSGMTDVYALDLYRKINGNSLPAI